MSDHAIAPRALQDPARLDDLLGKVKIFKKVVPIIEKAAKDYLRRGGELPGWQLKARSGGRYISDLSGAWSLLGDHFSEEEFLEGCKAARGKWRELWIEKGLKQDEKATRASLGREFDALMAPVTKTHSPAEILERKP